MTVARIAALAWLLACWPLVSAGETPLQSLGMGAECAHQVEQMSGSPGYSQAMEAVRKSCFQRHLSARCAEQVNAPPAVRRDDACVQELGATLRACNEEIIDASGRYARSRLGAKCADQWTAALQKSQQMQKRCEEELARRSEHLRRCLKLAPGAERDACVASMSKNDAACAQ